MVVAERAPSIESPTAISTRAGSDDDADVFVLSPEELDETISKTLADAGCSLEQLRSEARSGKFSSESNWRLWFCISPFVEATS
ncbi:MAG: hypothetical protein OXF41_15215 [bacterium]|nr:hypothetical protein [bacterium]